jgi:hypothetical protein
MDFANISRANLIKIGVTAIIVLLLLSRCVGSDTETDQDIDLDNLDDFSVEDIRDEISRDLERQLTIIDIPVSDNSTINADADFNREDFVDVWKPTTTPYSPVCDSSDCEVLSFHEGSVHGVTGTQLIYNPNIDDAISQWGDCIMEVSLCFYEGSNQETSTIEMQENLSACVQKSECPSKCKNAYAISYNQRRSKEAWDIFEDVFSGEDALCLPKEAWRD